jgi:predicted permease
MALLSRLVALFRKRQLDGRVDEEMLFHLEKQVEENIRRGMSPQEARRHARIASGGLEQAKELHRAVRGMPFHESLVQDIRYAVRRLRSAPGFTAVAVLTLALGLSVNATIFGLISSIFLRPLPVKDADRLVVVMQQYPNSELRSGMAWSDYNDYREQIRDFSDILAIGFRPASLRIDGQPPDRAWIEAVSGNYFSMLGVAPFAGRLFLPGEAERPNADPIAILSYDYWLTRLGGDPSFVGRTIAVNGHPLTIVGIAPEEFSSAQWSLAPSIFVPATMAPLLFEDSTILQRRDSAAFKVIAKLAPGVAIQQANNAVQALGRRLAQEYRPDSDVQVAVQPERLTRPEPSVSRFLPFAAAVFAALAILVLFTSCANVANLMFARAVARQNEISTRRAIGAQRSRLVRQLLTESALLAALAGAVGLLFSHAAGIWLSGMTANTGDVPIRPDQRWDWLPVVATMAVALVAGAVTGLLPALRATRGDLIAVIKSGAAGSGRERHFFRSGLVLGQIAMSVAVLACGALFVRALVQLSSAGLGFRSERLLMASVDLDLQGYDQARALRFFEQFVERAEALPGVASAAVGAHVPFDNYMTTGRIALPDAAAAEEPRSLQIGLNMVDSNYLETLGVTILAGRGIAPRDDADSAPVAVINETLAERLWPGQDAVGRSFRWQSGEEPVEVIGVARNGKYLLLGEAPRPYVYVPIAQRYQGLVTVHLRSSTDAPLALAPAVRGLIRDLDGDLPVFNVRTMDEHLRSSALGFLPLRLGALLAGTQGLIALFLAVLGVYGVVASAVGQSKRSIAIRIAMGAQKVDIFRLVARSGLRPAVIGLFLGVIASYGLARILRALLYGVDPVNLPMFAGVFTFVFLVAVAACWLPARRVLSLNPVAALRHE